MAHEQDDPEVIRRQMEVQRASLAEKLDTLENKIVETVEGAREAVAETVQTVKDSVQSSVDTVKETVQSSVESVKDTFDIPQQVQRHPWAMFGGSVALGFAAGWALNRAASGGGRCPEPSFGYSPAAYTGGTSRLQEEPRAAAGFTMPAPPAAGAPPWPSRESWLDQLTQLFNPELQKLKGLAIGSALGVVRDLVAGAIPEHLRPQVSEIIDGINTKLGGERVEGHLLAGLMSGGRAEFANGRHREEVPV
jgi:ElaB/YqjD/DUF883 family membrane-anchored ribosome-binding protein